MTKADIIDKITEETGLIQEQVADVVQRVLDTIILEVSEGRGVEIRNFGVWEVKAKKARTGTNFHKPGVRVEIPATSVVKFYPGKEMRESVAKLPVP